MAANGERKPLLEISDVTGELQLHEHRLSITGSIAISNEGTITLNINPVPLNDETKWLMTTVPNKGRLATWVSLRASAPDAPTIESDYITLLGRGTQISRDAPATISLQAQASQLTIHHGPAPATASNCSTRYLTVGMRGFAAQHATTTVGEIRLAGQSEIKNHDELAGFLQITAYQHEASSIDDWLAACDTATDHILQIISLAEAKRIHWSIRQTFHDNQLLRSDLYGPRHTGDPYDGMFHFLNLQPVLDLAVNHYTQQLRDTTGIELAINLLLANPGHAELLLISSMTALEHLVSSYEKQHPTPQPLDEDLFNDKVKPVLEATYDRIVNALPRPAHKEQKEKFEHGIRRVRDRIANLNHTTFTDKLFSMLHAYQVPLVGIEDRIKAFIDARQRIIHTGEHDAAFKDFYLHIAVLRELLKRIILTLLKYDGDYISFLNGQEFLHFPPTNVTLQP